MRYLLSTSKQTCASVSLKVQEHFWSLHVRNRKSPNCFKGSLEAPALASRSVTVVSELVQGQDGIIDDVAVFDDDPSFCTIVLHVHDPPCGTIITRWLKLQCCNSDTMVGDVNRGIAY